MGANIYLVAVRWRLIVALKKATSQRLSFVRPPPERGFNSNLLSAERLGEGITPSPGVQ